MFRSSQVAEMSNLIVPKDPLEVFNDVDHHCGEIIDEDDWVLPDLGYIKFLSEIIQHDFSKMPGHPPPGKVNGPVMKQRGSVPEESVPQDVSAQKTRSKSLQECGTIAVLLDQTLGLVQCSSELSLGHVARSAMGSDNDLCSSVLKEDSEGSEEDIVTRRASISSLTSDKKWIATYFEINVSKKK